MISVNITDWKNRWEKERIAGDTLTKYRRSFDRMFSLFLFPQGMTSEL